MAFLRYLTLFCVFAVALSTPYEKSENEVLEEYIAQKRQELNLRYRPHYHVAPPVGWMNDPNGFSYYKGQFHLFYQFYPYRSEWGPMHWGHSSSPNLVDWQTLPTALIPGKEQCFSGSAVVDDGTMILMYTGHELTDKEPYYNETQYLAYSDDGVNFVKYQGNPVLPAAPNGSPDFRDPKVWRHGDHWYVILGSKTEDQRGRALIYRSADMIEWEFLRVLGESNGDLGYMWECPDFFELDGKYVLLWSPQGMAPQGDRYKNLHQTGFIIGSFNYDTFEFVPETDFQEIDYGHDFYASQTTEKDGKRYLVAWFNMWENYFPEAVDGWAGAMTIIRELSIYGDRVLMKPVDEMYDLRDGVLFHDVWNSGSVIEFGQTGEVILQIEKLNSKIKLLLEGRDGGDQVYITWDPEEGKVAVNKTGDVRQVEWSPIGSVSWRMFLDASSLELFCGEGEVVFSTRAYPNKEWNLFNLSPRSFDVEAYSLRRSVPY